MELLSKHKTTKKPRYLPAAGLMEGEPSQGLGNDLLSHRLGSTIGAAGLNYSVRNGKRWTPCAIVTKK